MLGRKSRPIVGKLSDLFLPRNKPSFFNPKIPLDFKSSSPKSYKRYDVCGVGLGIVAALEKSSFTDCRNRAICSSNLNRSNAIVVDSGKGFARIKGRIDDLEEDYYSYVISPAPGNSSTNNGDEQRNNKETRFGQHDVVYSTSDFLNFVIFVGKSCMAKTYTCIGFCSAECRSRQIMMDERREHYRSKASRSARFSTSPYNNTEQIFSTGILAI